MISDIEAASAEATRQYVRTRCPADYEHALRLCALLEQQLRTQHETDSCAETATLPRSAVSDA